MTERQDHIKQIYGDLLDDYGSPGQRVRNRIDQGSPINLYAARSFPHKNVLLEIGPIKKAYLPAGFTRPRIKGLNISVDSSQSPGSSGITLLLELQQADAIDIFLNFVVRVSEEMDRIQRPADAVRALIALIERWKDFFSGSSELLSEGRQTGLYGELHLIGRLYSAGLPLDQLVRAWTGSKRTDQDFEFGAISIEVKSTAAVDATTVNISNIRQLDDTGLELLLLNRILLDARQGVERTLPILIASLRTIIANHAPEMALDFEEKILATGYRNEHSEQYATRSYTERALEFYEVREGFPRLLKSNLPMGVTNASYEITLETCQSFEIQVEDVIAALRKKND